MTPNVKKKPVLASVSCHLAEPHECLLPDCGDVIVVEVEMVQVPQVSNGLGRHLAQLVLGQHQVGQGVALGGHGLRAEGLHVLSE